MDKAIEARINEWLGEEYDPNTRQEIQNLIDSRNENELLDRFYTELEFGTAGLRGTLGAGSNRMNVYNVRKATQGLANYILKKNGASRGVLIGRDSRIMSDIFALETASVLIANGIKVFYFEDIHPTPTVSFGLQFLKAISGVMITASHNPKEYNGYKVLWEDGAQITPPYDEEIIEEVRNIHSLSQVRAISTEQVAKSPLFETVDERVDSAYLDQVVKLSIHPEAVQSKPIKVCYSPLYGTGYKLIPESLKKFGFTDIAIVKEQYEPDGNFPTAPYPNPEERETMKLGVEYSKKIGADVFIATDPDADRIGACLKTQSGDFVLLNGNQIATLLTYYVASELAATKKMPPRPAIIKTIVTTDLITHIAKEFDVAVDEVLTGFKWIGLQMNVYEKEPPETRKNFIFGCEESHGYLSGTFVRDKDAVIAASLLAEAVAFYLSQGTSAYQVLEGIYQKYGFFSESQKSVTMKGADGAEKIKALMEKLRKNPPQIVGGYEVLSLTDLKTGDVLDLKTKQSAGKLKLPSSNVIVLKLSDNAKIIARPSGTEPKIKFYFTSYGKSHSGEAVSSLIERVNTEHEGMKQIFLKTMGLD